jgi:hypothetical protein
VLEDEFWLMTIILSRWVDHSKYMRRLPRLNESKDGYIERPKCSHLVDRQRKKFSLYSINQIRFDKRYSFQRSKMKFTFAQKLIKLKFEESSSLNESFIESSRNSSRMFSKNSKKWHDSKTLSSFKFEQTKSNWKIIFIK